MLLVRRGDLPPLVVKDWSQRSAVVRRVLAPWLIRHELAMLERARGLPGLPRPEGRIDALAFALEYVGGAALRRRRYGRSLPNAFFVALEGILEGLRQRGLLYTDLRSPSNIMVTETAAPALVDLGSALAIPMPRSFRQWLERRALAKLRARFEGDCDLAAELSTERPVDYQQVDLGRERMALLDEGREDDEVPVLLLADLGVSIVVFQGALAGAGAAGRRALAVDLPGFGRSRASRASVRPARLAAELARLLDALRVSRVDVVGQGFGDRVGRALAVSRPERVRAGLTLAADPARMRGAAAQDSADALRRRIRAGFPASLAPSAREEAEQALAETAGARLVRACRALEHAAPLPEQPWSELDADVYTDAAPLWRALGALVPG